MPKEKSKNTVKKPSSTKTTTKKSTKTPVKKTEKKSETTKVVKKKTPQTNAKKKAELVKKLALQAEEIKTPTALSSKANKKESNKIPTWVWIFFWCSLLLFCISLYMAFLRPKIQQPIEQPNDKEQEIIISNHEEDINDSNNTQPKNDEIKEQNSQAGQEALSEFYQKFSSKDTKELQKLFDSPLQKSTDIQKFFSEYKITPFIDNIEGNSISPENIELLSTSPSGVEEYQYNINYKLNNQEFSELRKAKIRYTTEGAKIASIHCESHRCSYNPFFRPESYGLI